MSRVDKLLIFDVVGEMAHFRAFYTNSSSLSYIFPPRTAITGLIAGILGRNRDSYYSEFSSEKCHVALSIKNPVRKIMQCVNFIRTKNIGEVNGSAGHTQIPIEIVLCGKLRDLLRYRVYFWHREKTFDELLDVLESKNYVFPPYLGITEFIADLQMVDLIEGKKIKKLDPAISMVSVSSVVNIEKMEEKSLVFKSYENKSGTYVREKMPLEFDEGRLIKKTSNFICETNGEKLVFKPLSECYNIEYNTKGEKFRENIIFME